MTMTLHTNRRGAARMRRVLLGSSLVLAGTLMGAAPALASPAAPRSGVGIHADARACTLTAGAGPAVTVAANGLETAHPETTRTATLEVWQRASASLAERQAIVSYELVAERADAPMPAGAAGTAWTWQMRGNDSASIVLPCSGAKAGTYRYSLRQVSGNQGGLVYDGRTFALELYLSGTDADPVCIVRDASGSKTSDIGWTVSEKPSAPQDSDTHGPLEKIWGLLPKTGDTSALLLLLMALACPPIALGALIAKRRRQPATDSISTSQEA